MTTNSYELKNFFDDFEYALFGIFEPKLDDKDLESKKLDIATGGKDAEKETRRKWIENNDTKTNDCQITSFVSRSKSR